MTTEISPLTRTVRTVLSWIGIRDAEQKMRENAANWLELATKVFHYRRDILAPALVTELQTRSTELKALLKEKSGAEKLKLGIERLEEVLSRAGGAHYPKSALVENVEFFLVAALVILGIRTYFIQPFKIPTNSMWPTYNGMTPQAFRAKADEPSLPMQAARLVAFGASPTRVDAPADGEILIPVQVGFQIRVPFRKVPGRTWLVIPTTLKEYTLIVGNRPVTLQVPEDFDFEWAVRDAFFPNAQPSHEPGHSDLARVFAAQADKSPAEFSGQKIAVLRTGKIVKAGERAMAFDILTGDNLFVDRISYHFVRPSVGSGFVFRTGNIPGIAKDYGDQYYIKRLVGVPGDTLEIKEFTLNRNGAPITGSEAFRKNGLREGDYPGYRYEGVLARGAKLTIPPHEYFAMGDNSANSADGRYWGTVPAKDVVGRPIAVYFPFTKHWGPAR